MQGEKLQVHCTPTEVKTQVAGSGWGGGGKHLASFSIQSEKLWTQLTCPTFNVLPVCVSPLSPGSKKIWSRTEDRNSPGNSGCWMPVAYVLSGFCDVNAADSLTGWFNLTHEVGGC